MNDVLNSFIENAKSVPGFIAVSVTEIESGVAYESFSARKDFDPNLASAYNLEVVKAKMSAIKALGLKEDIQDITITLTDQVHIINIAPSGAYFIYLAVDSKDANMGITKSLLNKYKVELNKAL
ncbi:hypothetical protein C7447_101964 [Tenacibaculum adriaticum]|uniref:Uncharacterized protein n=1 Tax=Tenacibaculum adriaticum TaxID=413713 RepID=A0A5S5DWY4_9FLAO|nr:hypothetical protein [Tenacibaculum adriaticum]TYQ00352.1 hypothetical protein C7447_101964 [Tenacibaculum adriaticum]